MLLIVQQPVFSQVVSFNTQTLGSGYTANNGQNGITFVIQNTNPYPAVLNSVSNFFGTFGSGIANFTLWYSATSLSGAPGVITAPTWSPVASVTGVNCPAGTQTTVFPLLAFSIPAGTTYRFFLESPTITLDYVNSGATVTPNVFTNNGVSLIVGDATIAGLGVGFGGPASGPTFNPRSFIGSVSLTLLSSPCVGTPTAGIASALPANPCPGIPVTLSLSGTTAASGITFQWYRAPSPAGPWTTAGLTTAQSNPSYYTPPPGSTTFYRCIVTCTNTGLTSTSNATSAVIVQPWSATGPCWCTPTYANGGTQDHIINVTLGTLTNNTAAAGNPSPFYVNYTTSQTGSSPTLSTPNLYAGLSSTLTISYGTDPNQYGAMWIDYDHSGAFDASEYVSPNTNAGSSGTHVINFTPPGTSVPGLTRMRIRAGDDVQMNANQACGPTNSTWGETEDYLVNIIPAGPYDPALVSINAPVGNFCPDSNQTLSIQVANYGSSVINLALHPMTVTLSVNGPAGQVLYPITLNTGVLPSFGATQMTVTFNPVNMFAGGPYSINGWVSCPTLTNGTTINDSLGTPISIMNYRPNAGPDYPLCQYSNIPFGQGLTVGGCSVPLSDSVTINFTILGPCNDGNSDATSCQFATGILPALINGASITGGVLKITNLATISSSWMSEMRFGIYGISPTGSNIFSPGVQAPGSATTTSTNFTYTRPVSGLQLSNLYTAVSPGSPVNIGYWESFNDVPGSSDISTNAAGGPTVATLKIYYQYVPPAFAWYDVPAGGNSLYSLSPFNPLAFSNAVVNNSNVQGLYTFYAACLGLPTCRVPVHLLINPTPAAYQDTLLKCEYANGANNAAFDLTSLNGFVSGGLFPTVSVDYYGDQALITQIMNPTNDTSSTNVIYSKVYYASTGCYSSDTVYLDVSSIPQFTLPIYTGFACAPSAIDISSLISIFPSIGNDTLFFNDPLFTSPYTGNPHAINVADTVYMITKTSNSAACKDTAMAYIDVLAATNNIANQDPGNFSVCGAVGCGTIALANGNTETLYTTTDCRRIATVTDNPTDLINLGNVSICEDIDCSIGNVNGQPYVNRHYEITPTTNGKAQVCLYYLQQDFDDYNSAAFPAWPFMDPTVNLCINQVDNGDINTPGHTAISIPNSVITSTYDPVTTVWTVCFPVDSFSYFYCATCNPLNIPLPVSLLSFEGKRVNGSSALNWITSSEQNNSHFIVERSKDGKTFNAISDKIKSKGMNGNSNMQLSYDYTDASPMNAHNYYRLQQVDIDGHMSYSGTLDIYFGNETLVTMYPNPVNTELTVDVNTPDATRAQVKIMDATGRVVRTVELTLQAGSNSTKIDMQSLTDGLYLVRISNQKEINYTQTIRKK